MTTPDRQNLLDLLKRLRGIEPLKEVFWSELNYEHVNQPLPRRAWTEAAQLIEDGIARTIQQKKVTYDLERLMPGAAKLGTSAFAGAIIENMKGMAVAR